MILRALLVEDDASVATVIASALKADGFSVTAVTSLRDRDLALRQANFDVMVTDVGLGSEDGITALDMMEELAPALPVIVISARNTLDTAVRASETGAYEYFPKPFDIDELVRAARSAARRSAPAISADNGSEDLPLVGSSPAMQGVYRMIAKLLRNDLSVLILGESGTGKELVAEAIHNLGHRRTGPFVAINMAAIPSELIESELFGYEKGAFTGATATTQGKFEQAAGGTLFLDEIGDMPMAAQTRLLRALQSGAITRVGGAGSIKLDVRIITATNQDIEQLIAQGRFREDLYYRINVVPILLPPLRERKEDIDALVRHFLSLAAAEGLPVKQISDDGMALMRSRPWRGNVRELKNSIYRLVVTAREDVLDAGAILALLDASIFSGANSQDVGQALTDELRRMITNSPHNGQLHAQALELIEVPLITQTLASVNGNQIKAAAMLGINRNTLRKKIGQYQICPGKLR